MPTELIPQKELTPCCIRALAIICSRAQAGKSVGRNELARLMKVAMSSPYLGDVLKRLKEGGFITSEMGKARTIVPRCRVLLFNLPTQEEPCVSS